MPDHDQTSSAIELRDRLDAILMPRGFSSEAGVDVGPRQLLWCAPADDFASRFPDLPVSNEPAKGWGLRCTDLTIDIDKTWRVTGVSIEGYDLIGLLAGLGLTNSADRAGSLVGLPVADCLELPSLILDLLNGAGGAPASE